MFFFFFCKPKIKILCCLHSIITLSLYIYIYIVIEEENKDYYYWCLTPPPPIKFVHFNNKVFCVNFCHAYLTTSRAPTPLPGFKTYKSKFLKKNLSFIWYLWLLRIWKLYWYLIIEEKMFYTISAKYVISYIKTTKKNKQNI